MKILALTKRRPQGRDLLTRPYGRFFYLPYHLAKQGHEVTLLLLSYQADPPEHRYQHGIDWYSESLLPIISNHHSPWNYIKRAKTLIDKERLDWIIGFSDTWYGILAQRLAAYYGCKSLIDAYDNYESYIPWAKPLHWAWRRALRRATALTVAGPNLGELMAQGRSDNATVVPMAADPMFHPMDRAASREQLGLPLNTPLVGYCGSLYRSRGVETLFQVIEILFRQVPGVKLVLSGRRQKGVEVPSAIRASVIECGYLPDDQMPVLLNAMNVLLTINRPSAFGEYSYPVKIYESMRCGVPVVATAVAGTSWILRNHPECLVSPYDAAGLAKRVEYFLGAGGPKNYGVVTGWRESAATLMQLMDAAPG